MAFILLTVQCHYTARWQGSRAERIRLGQLEGRSKRHHGGHRCGWPWYRHQGCVPRHQLWHGAHHWRSVCGPKGLIQFLPSTCFAELLLKRVLSCHCFKTVTLKVLQGAKPFYSFHIKLELFRGFSHLKTWNLAVRLMTIRVFGHGKN